jgi:hypothetical protein
VQNQAGNDLPEWAGGSRLRGLSETLRSEYLQMSI